MSSYRLRFDPIPVSWTTRDVLLFANSIGSQSLVYLYEDHARFQPFPTYPLMLSFKHAHTSIVPFRQHFDQFINVSIPGVPRLDSTRAVDGGRSLHVHRTIPGSSQGRVFQLRTQVEDVADKGTKGTVVNLKHTLFETPKDASEEIIYVEMKETVFYVRQGGWGGPKGFAPAKIEVPESEPTFTHQHHISDTAHLLYRLNGDYNPLHADPDSPSAAAFGGIIMHGLYSWNVTARIIVEQMTQIFNNANTATNFSLQEFQGRFLGMVRPGDTLLLRFWTLSSEGKMIRPETFELRGEGCINVVFSVSVKSRQNQGPSLMGKAVLQTTQGYQPEPAKSLSGNAKL